MRTISARQFRDTMAEITEPVEVVLREGDGTMRRLGTWTPGADPSRVVANGGYVGDPTPARRPFLPAPKPSQK